MARIYLGQNVEPIPINIKNNPAHCCLVEGEIDRNLDTTISRISSETRGHPQSKWRPWGGWQWIFILIREVLYKKSSYGILLRYLEEACQRHVPRNLWKDASGHMMVRRIQRVGYFRMTLDKDCIDYVRKYHKCQVYGDKINAFSAPLSNWISPWPFVM